jgi:hypothetical protein
MYLIYYLPKDIDISFSTGNLLGEGCGEGEAQSKRQTGFYQKGTLPPWCKMFGT